MDGYGSPYQSVPGIAEAAPTPQMATYPQFNVSFQTGAHYKVHKSYVFLGPVVAVLAFVAIAALQGMQGWIELAKAINSGNIAISPMLVVLIAIGSIVLVLGLMMGLYALAYRNMSYVFDEREFSFYSGIITKRRVHVPYARVQSVNHRASLVQRIAGVCTVVIDSAGGAGNKAVRAPYVTLAVAEAIRTDLFVRKAAAAAGLEGAVHYVGEAGAAGYAPALGAAPTSGVAPAGAVSYPQQGAPVTNVLDDMAGDLGQFRGVFGGEMAGLEPVSYEFGLSNKELVFTALSHDTPLVVAFTIFITALISVIGIVMAEDDFAFTVASIAIPIVVVSTVLTYLVGLVGIAISYGGFSARRRGTRIEVERGLIQRVFSGIDIERVQSVEIRQTLVRRMMGYCEVSLGRIGTSGDKGGSNNSGAEVRGLVVHPFVKLDRVDELLAGLAPELAERPRVEQLYQLPPVALRRSVLRRCVWFNGALWTILLGLAGWILFSFVFRWGDTLLSTSWARESLSQLFGIVGVLVLIVFVVVTALRGAGAVLWARHSGYAFSPDFIALYNDGLSTRYVAVPRKKIQSGNTRSNPFQRRLELTSLYVTTAAGTSSTSVRLLDVPEEVGEGYLDWLKPRH